MSDTTTVVREAAGRGGAVEPGQVLLEISGGTKTYRGVHAIHDVSFDVRAGEVHALLGENGAGKSTLCKVIAGAIQLSSGELRIDGEPVQLRTPHDALERGIAMVYQETSLVPTMTAAQNIELGHERLFTRFRSLNIGAQQLLQSMNFHVDPTAYVSALGGAKKQMVEIARAIRSRARIIIFDEPTATLTPEETLHLFNVIEDLRRSGMGIVYVSHALEESLQIADRVTVLRDGEHVVTLDAKTTDRGTLVRHMVGRALSERLYGGEGVAADDGTKKRKVLEVENLILGTVVKNMSFSAYAGEVLGIAGLIGSGRTETAKIVAGALKRNRIHGGRVLLNGRTVRYRVPAQAIDDGIVYITEDRKVNGFFETMTVEENLYLGRLGAKARRRPWVSRRERRRVAKDWIERLNIRAINPDAKVVELSGGNQQKVTVGKSLVQEPEVVIFDEPTRGVDVGAIEEIHQLIRRLADEGKTVIVISSYLPEVLSISDRILVARLGRIVAEFTRDEATQEKIMYAAIF
ncbi:MAG TPA: sugar ABC transporter ATP-binding protein [Mycobacteriales bacterium]